MPSPKDWVFDEPIYIDIVKPGQIVSADKAGAMKRAVERGVVEITSPQGLVNFAAAAQEGKVMLTPPLVVQLFLKIWQQMGKVVRKGERKDPEGIVH